MKKKTSRSFKRVYAVAAAIESRKRAIRRCSSSTELLAPSSCDQALQRVNGSELFDSCITRDAADTDNRAYDDKLRLLIPVLPS
ncbi:unnamed protein product [Trichogramma brassicae]|uniref:Uncharacterized protein n=1 Tax=Trichogramma brassicae TaxID=86971 RepID=A0A6H5J2I9_9HYME|nr:unnamed protein product [Trichogramma brassicae]